ncbi:class IIb bacteriocin, lactobin A/cerein 7B family [Aquimarina longa]|uniref:class IIb bacteriocin, lactobin A/cerein 7B family n=1 Tax=Aquimarina longa TaxID=1080221 RepID=UPI0007808274|nr:class IIb bacteriocin, lactobin A/cerein 7B family [Aquimarina longa]
MRNLKIEEIDSISGGPIVLVIPPLVKAVAAVGALVGAAITGGYAVGKVAGEAAQRIHEGNHDCKK